MKTYQDALDWIALKSKEYGSKNEFLSSDEYRKAYPEVEKLRMEEILNISYKGKKAMEKVGAKEGQRVYYDVVGSWGYVEPQEGIIKFDKNGIPKVKLTSGKTVRWHKGFIPL
jgi:hypothetical protein